MGLGVTGVSELVLEVDDLEQAEWFYSEILELPVVERWEDRRAIWVMAGDRTRIGLWEPQVGLAGGQGGQHVHYAMHLEPERYDDAVAFGIIHNRLRDWDGDIDFRPRPARRKPILTLTPSCRLSSPLPWA